VKSPQQSGRVRGYVKRKSAYQGGSYQGKLSP
jgi:hypothetical protein